MNEDQITQTKADLIKITSGEIPFELSKFLKQEEKKHPNRKFSISNEFIEIRVFFKKNS